MAPTKAPYDPVKALEGMFNGSVTRIAYAIKDPVNYAGLTNAVLTECAKRFHDALDDCEIQVLDAKWYLEHQLAENKVRREAKARETGTAVKRKHDMTRETNEPQIQEETPSKRSKIDMGNGKSLPTKPDQIQPENVEVPTQPTPKQTEKPISQQSDPQITSAQPLPSPKQDKALEPKEDQVVLSQDDFAKPTPQATPAGTNDDFNFESMFGDPTGDPGSTKEDDDLGFDLGLDGTFDTQTDIGAGNGTIPDPSSLDSLLPGLDTYANQTGDIINTNNINNNTDTTHVNIPTTNPTTNIITTESNPTANTNGGFSNEFDLPEMGGANDFDDFLNDDTLGATNYGDNADLGDQSFLDMTLDDSFFS